MRSTISRWVRQTTTDERGVTLVELLIVIVIISFLSTTISINVTGAIDDADAEDLRLKSWTVAAKFDEDVLQVVGVLPGTGPFSGQPTISIDNVLGIATISGDTTGTGAGNGSYVFFDLQVEAIGDFGDVSSFTYLSADFRDNLNNPVSVTLPSPGTITLQESPAVPAIAPWLLAPLSGLLATLVFWERRRRRRYTIANTR